MLYKLENVTSNNLDILIKYKLNSILEYVKDLNQDEINRINNYVNNHVLEQIKYYKIIKVNNKIIGCLLAEPHLDGVILDEIFIEDEYRNKKIGTNIIKDVLRSNSIIVYIEIIKMYTDYIKN